jgi:dimethylhistidine N-methyltransferase
MKSRGDSIGDAIGPRAMIVEYGSGSSVKTRVLLDHLDDPVAYCPVDISKNHLLATAGRLDADYPRLEVLPIAADFSDPFQLPTPKRTPRQVTIYFPGSTIGNFEVSGVKRLLGQMADQCRVGSDHTVGSAGQLLIGIDLQKDRKVIEAAYNDASGVTDEFSLNLLTRINRELGANFDEDSFQHRATYDCDFHRVDIRLVSLRAQTVTIGEHEFQFAKGETIHTEYSHKYTITGFAELAATASFCLRDAWSDEKQLFAILLLSAANVS